MAGQSFFFKNSRKNFRFLNGLVYLYSVRILFVFILILALAGTCSAAESFALELYADTQKTAGLKVDTPLAQFRTAGRPDKFNAGFSLSSKALYKKLPVEVKIGNLSASGSLSKLNSPELSSGSSPFSSGISPVNALSANLPGYTSFSKPESSFVQLSMNQFCAKEQALTVNLWASPENDSPVFSALISDKFFEKRLVLNASWTAGQFLYDDNYSTSWFLDSPAYKADSHFCSLVQLSAEIKNKSGQKGLYSGFMAAFYESPFGPYTAVYRADLRGTLRQTEIYASAFLNACEDTLTSSRKKLEPSCQFKSGLLTKKPLLFRNNSLIFLKLGLNAYSKINLLKTEHPLRINSGLQLSTDITSVSLSLSGAGNIIYGNDTASSTGPARFKKDSLTLQIKNTWYLKSFSPGFAVSAQKSEEDTKYKIQLNVTNNSKHKVSGDAVFSFTENGGDVEDKKFSASLTGRLNLKRLTVIGKASASFSL